ncbi:putative esterase KAI2 [Platanthera zijinensis]|uniref:Esterase KAI2 n=1 Tax=Platanthera zijinensis TaxID=2320716 RepID=A0AAP0BTN7_9ASPA
MAVNRSIVGSGKVTLVLSHGYGGSRAVWDAVVPQLSLNYQLLLFDWNFTAGAAFLRPAPLDSSQPTDFSFEAFADELISLLDEIKMKGVVFVGHSMSGMIGCIASVKRPELFAHLLLVSASPRYMNLEDYEGGFDVPMIESLLNSIRSDFHSWSESFAAAAMATDDPIPLQKFRASLQAMNRESALALGEMIFYSDLRHVLRKVEAPCTIIQGANDIAVPVAVAHYMKSEIKGKATVEIIENHGHFPQLTSPARFVRIVEREVKY